jgi:3-oxoacyl-[acyl-carrier protein] reductase
LKVDVVRVLVIGGSSSIGRKVVSAFADRGDSILSTYAKTKVDVPDGVRLIHLDLERTNDFEDFAEQVTRSLGSLDVLIFLVGVLPGKSLVNYPTDLIQSVVQVNFVAFALLMQKLLSAMAEGSQVLVMSSISAERGSYDPIYAATKAALIGMVKSLATWHGQKVRFNCIAPGLVENSTMFNDMVPVRRQHHQEQSPTGALTTIEELAQIIVSLTEPQWKQLNGAVLRVNGGSYV